MNRLTNLPLALALGGALALGVTSAAQADVMATSVSEITNFEIHKTGGAALDYSTDFLSLTFTSTGGYAGTLPGTAGYNTSSSAAPVDLPKTCVGNGCAAWDAAYGAENSFTHLSAPPAGNYSAADQFESGAPILNLPGGFPLGATVSSAAYAGLTTQNALSHSTATNNLNSNFRFTLASAGALDFNFNAETYLQVAVTNDEKFPGFATAAFLMEFSLSQETLPGVFAPIWSISSGACGTANEVNPLPVCVQTISLNAPLLSNTETILTGGPTAYSFTTPVLAAGTLYQLSARNNSNADVQRIPEPGELALLGIGLIGMTLVMARRRNQNPMGGAV